MKPQKETPPRSHDHLSTQDTPLGILVVEDDSSVAAMVKAALRTWDYEVWVARNGQEGLDLVVTQSVDAIILDMHMPIMNGRTMLDELRWLGYQLPVLVMSEGSDIQALRQFLQEGAQGFLIKPFELQSLQRACAQTFFRLRHERQSF